MLVDQGNRLELNLAASDLAGLPEHCWSSFQHPAYSEYDALVHRSSCTGEGIYRGELSMPPRISARQVASPT
jgi:hypothetical protein